MAHDEADPDDNVNADLKQKHEYAQIYNPYIGGAMRLPGIICFRLAVIVGCLTIWVPSLSQAQPNELPCKRYAQESVRQNQQNLALKAGFGGPSWSSDFNGHYNWCMHGANVKATPSHLFSRAKELQHFAIEQFGTDEAAKRYGSEAVRQYNQSKALGTGFRPPVWSSDYNGHYNWSKHGGNINTTPDHLAARERALQDFAIKNNRGPVKGANQYVKAAGPVKVAPIQGNKGIISPNDKRQFCNKYADTALEQVELARKNNLPGIVPPVWSDNRDGHFQWCLKVDKKSAEAGTKLRQDVLNKHVKAGSNKHGTVVSVIPGVLDTGVDKLLIPAATGNKLKKSELLRSKIKKIEGGNIKVTPGTSFSIAKGSTETRHLIDVPKAGLYKIGFSLGASKLNGYKISLRIDKENYRIVLDKVNSGNTNLIIDKNGNPAPQATFKKTGSKSFSPWIISDQNLSTYDGVGDADFYFWVDKEHVPIDGKLQVRFEVVGMVHRKEGKGDAQETFKKPNKLIPLTEHEGIVGNFHVEYAVPYTASFSEHYDINQASFPYSIITLPSVQQSKMQYSVITTSVLQVQPQTTNSTFEPPMVSFLVANSDNIKRPNEGLINPVNKGGISVSMSKNDWYYKSVLKSKVFGQKPDCGTVTVNSKNACAKYKMFTHPKSQTKAKIIDLANPSVGEIAILVNNNPVNLESQYYLPPSIEKLGTKGFLTTSTLHSKKGDNLRNEVFITTRNMQLDWTYVAELSGLEISEQAEYDSSDKDDLNFGEFSIMATSVAVEPKKPGQTKLSEKQIESKSAVYPVVDARDRPPNINIMDRDNPTGLDVKEQEAITIPGIPIFVMGYDELQKFNQVSLNVTMVEHDERSFWQELGEIPTLFKNYMSALVGAVSKPGVGSLTSLGKSVYDFASTDLNHYSGVDDMMGNAGITFYKADNFGLPPSGDIHWEADGPADSGCFDMQMVKQGKVEAVVSKQPKCNNSRHITAHFRLRKIPKLEGSADIQLIEFTPVDLLPGRASHSDVDFVTRDFTVWEGVFSNNRDSFKMTKFENIGPVNKLKLRTPTPPQQLKKRTPGILPSDIIRDGSPYFGGTSWSNRGFVYYQAKINQYLECSPSDMTTWFDSYVSFTLYFEDVVKYAGLGGYQVLKLDGNREVMAIKSTKIGSTNKYKVDIRLRNPGSWVKEANLVAYVSITD